MSISTALLAGTSGLRANSSALAAISDNIANANTVGYKRIRNDFTALLNAQGASTYNAGGVFAQNTAMLNEQGALQQSTLSTHLAIAGNGFFVTREKAADASPADQFFYTRAGQFTPDAQGFLRNASDYYLYGWEVGDDGTVAASPTDQSALQPVRISGIGGAAEATTTVSFSANLQASQAISPAEATYDSATNNMASGAVAPDFQSSVQIYDSLGGIHTVSLSFLKSSAAANSWHVEVHVVPETDIQAGAGLANGQIATGTVAFTPFGQIDSATTTLPTSLAIGASAGAPGAGAANWASELGLAAQSISLEIGGAGSPGGLTQYDQESALTSSQVDGTAYGELSAVEVDQDGFVRALFTNGLSKNIYQLPIATFSNTRGLIVTQGGVYGAGPDAGPLSMKEAGRAGAGSIEPRALEASTVDLAEEFSNLITTQRAYSASSKIITTADEMLDELIRMKR